MTHSYVISFTLAILGIFTFIAVMDLLFEFIAWLTVDKSDGIILKFKDFEKYYCLNPSRYHLRENWVVASRRTYIYFSFLHNLQYKIWKRNLAKKKFDRALNLRLEEYLKTVQSDIEAKRKEAAAEMDKAADMINQIQI